MAINLWIQFFSTYHVTMDRCTSVVSYRVVQITLLWSLRSTHRNSEKIRSWKIFMLLYKYENILNKYFHYNKLEVWILTLWKIENSTCFYCVLISCCPSVHASAFLSTDEAASVTSVGGLLVEGWATSRKVSGCFQHSMGQDDVQAA